MKVTDEVLAIFDVVLLETSYCTASDSKAAKKDQYLDLVVALYIPLH